MKRKRLNTVFSVVRAALYFGGAVIVAAKASYSVKIEYWFLVALAVFLLVAGVAASVIIFRPDL